MPFRWPRLQPAVNVSAVGDANNADQKCAILYQVHDAVIPDANAMASPTSARRMLAETCKQEIIRWSGLRPLRAKGYVRMGGVNVDLDQVDKTVQSKSNLSSTLLLTFPLPEVAVFRRGGIHVRSRRLAAIALLALIVCGGAGVTALIVLYRMSEPGSDSRQFITWFIWLFGGFAALVMGFFIIGGLSVRPVVFDKKQGRFWRQGKHDSMIGDFSLIRDIQALQVCSGKVCSNESNTWTYDLNVILKGSPCQRFLVVCRSDRDMIFEDAGKLAEFLGVPLLDHTDKASNQIPPAFKKLSAWLNEK